MKPGLISGCLSAKQAPKYYHTGKAANAISNAIKILSPSPTFCAVEEGSVPSSLALLASIGLEGTLALLIWLIT